MKSYVIPTTDHKLWLTIDQVGFCIPMDAQITVIKVLVTNDVKNTDKRQMVVTNTFGGHGIKLLIDPEQRRWQTLPAGVYQVARNVPGAKARATILQTESYE